MSESRQVLDAHKVADSREKSKQHWKVKGLSMAALSCRAFDPFQHLDLVDPFYIRQACDKYQKLKPEDQEKWAKKVIQYACKTLLEKNGALKKEWIKRLGWEDNAACYIHDRIKDIVCSYVCIIILPAFVDIIARKKANNIHHLTHLFNANWVPDEIDANFSNYASGTVEADARDYSKWLFQETSVDEKMLINMDKWLLSEKKYERKMRQAFWLEVLTRGADNQIFKVLWDFFSIRINPMRDEPELSEYQRDQFRFCRRHFAKFVSTPKVVIPIAYPVIPEAKAGLAIEMVEMKKEAKVDEAKSEESDLSSYVVVNNGGPSSEYLSTFSLFNYVVDTMAEATVYVTHKLGVGSSDS